MVEDRLVVMTGGARRIELRGRHELIGLEQDEAGVTLNVRTPDGLFDMRAGDRIYLRVPGRTDAVEQPAPKPAASESESKKTEVTPKAKSEAPKQGDKD